LCRLKRLEDRVAITTRKVETVSNGTLLLVATRRAAQPVQQRTVVMQIFHSPVWNLVLPDVDETQSVLAQETTAKCAHMHGRRSGVVRVS
jgi:co-chaperonin GroES (HSP10)